MNKIIIKEISSKINQPLCILDLESTGIDLKKDEIIQFGCLRINPDGTYIELEFNCQPSFLVPEEAISVHGITNESLKNEKNFSEHLTEVLECLEGAVLAGYNIKKFDWPMLQRHLKDNGIDFKTPRLLDSYIIFCEHQKRRLSDSYKYYTGKEIKDAHSAIGDVISTSEILLNQMSRENLPINELIEKFTPKDTQEKILSKYVETKNGEMFLTFSKHKGKRLKDLDVGFFNWVLKTDFPECFKKIAKEYANKNQRSKKVLEPMVR